MDKDQFKDVLFAGAWYSFFANGLALAILMMICKYIPMVDDDAYIVALPIICPINMYFICKHLSKRYLS